MLPVISNGVGFSHQTPFSQILLIIQYCLHGTVLEIRRTMLRRIHTFTTASSASEVLSMSLNVPLAVPSLPSHHTDTVEVDIS